MRGRDKHRAHGDMGSISTTPRATGFFRPAAQSACGKGSFSRQGREEWAARCGATRGGACGVRGAHRGVKWGESVGRGRCSMRSGRAVRSGQGGACGAKGAQSGHWGHRACGRVGSTRVLREQKWCGRAARRARRRRRGVRVAVVRGARCMPGASRARRARGGPGRQKARKDEARGSCYGQGVRASEAGRGACGLGRARPGRGRPGARGCQTPGCRSKEHSTIGASLFLGSDCRTGSSPSPL